MSLMKLLKFKTWETGAFQYASFGNASFPNEALGYSCLWSKCFMEFLIQKNFTYGFIILVDIY